MVQNVLVLVASYVFYGWWDWRFLSLIAIITAYQLDNFKSIKQNFNIDYDKVVFIYDSQNLDADLCNYLQLNYSCIDFGKINKQKDMSFGFDKHWNDYGRSVIANLIIENH